MILTEFQLELLQFVNDNIDNINPINFQTFWNFANLNYSNHEELNEALYKNIKVLVDNDLVIAENFFRMYDIIDITELGKSYLN